ncbi:hypothetical protein [Lacticaseibacillus brantae]|uniref:Uncharacterized protein n=1 Tax=Lacticaseibacillus brantae DSM 23927 TaxID=1423727 RepID=A0A0R2B4N8_9LACO|nr:hypothetical protein [Lacticaseibacillus brantae]KRM71193.1 hypothetical protein FC34_GL001884 [Lacticaseibacillus brantae DSM 23927]
MLDVKGSIDRLLWTAEHHYLHIVAKHDFMRAWAVQFELAYTDFRTIQMALQLDGNHADLLKKFAADYDQVFNYEYAFAAGGVDGFYTQYPNQSDLDAYKTAKDALEADINQIQAING